MKREVRILKGKSVDSLILAVEIFNRPHDRGRVDSVLILLDHSFEMLLKASLLHRGAKIREKKAKQTIGFDACVRRGLSDAQVKFLEEADVFTLQTINGYRDAAQHHILELSEDLFFPWVQAGVTLFDDLLSRVFSESLFSHLPERVLPVSTRPPRDLTEIIIDEVETVKDLLRRGRRRRVEATARLRALAIAEASTAGEYLQPSEANLRAFVRRVKAGESAEQIFPGATALRFSTDGDGLPFHIRVSKKEGVPVHLVPEGTPGATVVAIHKLNETGFYSLGHREVAKKVGITPPRLTALIRATDTKSSPDFFKEIQIGGMRHERYSPKAVTYLREQLEVVDMDEIWAKYGPKRGSKKKVGRRRG